MKTTKIQPKPYKTIPYQLADYPNYSPLFGEPETSYLHETLILYHGTDKEIEGRFKISLAGSGIGWLNDSYGAGIYFSTNVEAARYYAFKAVQNTIIKNRIETGQENTDKLSEQRVYRTTLKQGAKILDASEPIDSKRAKEILLKAGVSETVIKVYTKKELSQFTRIARLIHKNPAFNNGFEYLTKELGYQGLKIKDEMWENPGENFEQPFKVDFDEIYKNIPEIMVIYDEKLINEPTKVEVSDIVHDSASILVFDTENTMYFAISPNELIKLEDFELIGQHFEERTYFFEEPMLNYLEHILGRKLKVVALKYRKVAYISPKEKDASGLYHIISESMGICKGVKDEKLPLYEAVKHDEAKAKVYLKLLDKDRISDLK